MKSTFLSLKDAPLTASSQAFLPIADILDDIVLYKDGGVALVMETTSLNFGLLSEKEQEAIIYAYAGLLNSLSFSIQILIRSQKKDISNYLEYLDTARGKIVNPKLAVLMDNYRRFIVDSVKKKNVLGKRFFIVIPFSPLELGITKSLLSVSKGSKPLPYPKSYVVKKAKIALYPKRDHLIRQAGRFGVKLRQLTNNELVDLFYTVFNPEVPMSRKQEGVGA